MCCPDCLAWPCTALTAWFDVAIEYKDSSIYTYIRPPGCRSLRQCFDSARIMPNPTKSFQYRLECTSESRINCLHPRNLHTDSTTYRNLATSHRLSIHTQVPLEVRFACGVVHWECTERDRKTSLSNIQTQVVDLRCMLQRAFVLTLFNTRSIYSSWGILLLM